MAAPRMPPTPERATQQAQPEAPFPSGAPAWPGPLLRADDFDYVALDETPLARSLAVIGVSGLGNAGSLAARYLIKHLEMKLVGAFQSVGLPPAAASHHGLMAGTLQVWSTESPCGPGNDCERLLVIKNDLPIDMSVLAALSSAVSKWAVQSGISVLVGIDSFPREESEEDRVLVGTSVEGRDVAGATDAKPLGDAIVLGFNACLVANANRDHIRALVFYGPRETPNDDAKAAAAALQSASKLLPRLDLTDAPAELERLERELERRLKAAMDGGRGGSGFRGYA